MHPNDASINSSLLLLLLLAAAHSCSSLQVGVGFADITGPAGEVPMMGYAETSQKTAGIHTRLYARAFAFRDVNGGAAVFVNVEAGMISQMLRLRVNELVAAQLGNIYSISNTLLSATHTHSGPGGFHGYTMYAIAALGYMGDTFESFSQGIAKSIIAAHRSLRPARLLFNEGTVQGTSINRSPTSYLRNPAAERSRYADNVDREMQVVKIVDTRSNKPFAMLNWHAVHATSLNNTNTMISGDNKGWASQMFERVMDNGATLPGQQQFLASFANSNEGDVSPNTAGPRCIDTGEPCDIQTSACGGSAKKCIASGPGVDMFDSARIVALKQFSAAKSLFDSADQEIIVNKVSHIHQSVNMANYQVNVNGRTVKTCPPAMGFSFAAGTTDGPGGFDFTQGDVSGNTFWNLAKNIISKPSAEQVRCQQPKPILLNTGEKMTFPTQWQPQIVETQLLRIGQLVLVALPGEFTTMSGRRLREAVQRTLASNGLPNSKVILCGLSNLYSSYVTTFEEYQAQRYEAASTAYGQHTLSAYIDQFNKLAKALATGVHLNDNISPPNLYSKIKSYSFITPVVYDSVGTGNQFGDVLVQPRDSYRAGDVVRTNFRSAHPRNKLMLNKTFLLVQRRRNDGSWEDVCNDACVETRFQWVRTSSALGRSEAHIEWHIPACVQSGTYRIRHFGNYKPVLLWQSVKAFSGTSRSFRVVNSIAQRAALMQQYSADVINAGVGSGCV